MSVVANVAINVDASRALGQLKAIDRASKDLDGGLKGAAIGAKGFGAALQSALGPLLAVSTAIATIQKSLSVAFERGTSEQRLKNLSSSTGEYEAALAAAASTSAKFGISQTEATTALADVYGRLKGVGFGLKETTEIYEGFNAIAKQSGISGADAAGVFFQLSQALGKGKLNGDEFVSVAERMPQLLDAIAAETGRSRGELVTMAQQGEITSDVLYKALAQSAGAAGDLNAKLTEQQKAFNSLRTVSDSLLNTIGKVFAPFVIKGAELLAAAGAKLSEWWDYLAAKVFPELLNAAGPLIQELQKIWTQIPWDTIIGYIQGAMLQGIKNITAVVKFLSPILAAVLNKFIKLSKNPVFRFIAEQVGRLVNSLGISTTKVAEFTAEQNKAKEATAATVAAYSSLPSAIEDSKEKTKQLKNEVAALKGKYQEIAASQNRASNALGNSLNIAQARYDAEKSIRDVMIGQLKTQLDQTTNQEARIRIARAIYNLEIANAKAALALAIQRIKAEQSRAAIAVQTQKLKAQELRAEMALMRSRKQDTTEIERAIRLQDTALQIAYDNQRATNQIAVYQAKSVDATYQAQKNAAELAFQQNSAAKAARQFTDNLRQAEPISKKIGQGLGQIFVMGSKRKGSSFTVAQPMAKGGYVNRATPAIVGEAGGEYIVPERKAADFAANYLSGARGAGALMGKSSQTIGITTGPAMQQGEESEYVIPASKMDEAMSRYASDQRNNSIIPTSVNPQVSVTTGPVMNMNGQNYVNQQDFLAGMQAASRSGAEMAIKILQNNPNIRRSVGA